MQTVLANGVDVYADRPVMENALGSLSRETVFDAVCFISAFSPMSMDLEVGIILS